MRRLNKMPALGHRREDLSEEALRFWSVRSYLIVYRADPRPIEIVRVLSGYRDIATLLSERVREAEIARPARRAAATIPAGHAPKRLLVVER